MISVKFLHKKRVRILAIVGLFLAIVLLAALVDGPFERYRAGKKALTITESTVLPIREISGIYLRNLAQNDPHGYTIVSVGDEQAKINVATVDVVNDKLIASDIIDFTKPIVDRFGVCTSALIPACRHNAEQLTSQWQSLNTDASGKVFLLHEEMASVVVYDAKNEEVTNVINLNAFSVEHERVTTRSMLRAKRPTGVGEGMTLLRNGHLLITKERNPPTIVEFGLSTEESQGYGPELSLRPDGVFALPSARVEMVPLQRWKVQKEYSQCDITELNTDSNGQLYFLSERCKLIGKIKGLDPTHSEFEVEQTWFLPFELMSVQSFVVFASGHFLVAVDHKSETKKNLFFLRQQI